MNENYVLLLDIYGELLSKTQRAALDLKYNEDFSLSESAREAGGVSRQSVYAALKNGERRLAELEEKLGNARRFREISAKLEEMERAAGENSELKKIIEDIRTILSS